MKKKLDAPKDCFKLSVRVRTEGGEVVEVTPAIHGVDIPPEIVREKLAILKVAPIRASINKVGWRRTEDIFYLRIYEDEV